MFTLGGTNRTLMSPPVSDPAVRPPAFWPRAPFLRMLIPLLFGIGVAYGTSFAPLPGLGWAVALLGLLLAWLSPRSLPEGTSGQRIFLLCFILFFSLLGYWRTVNSWPPNTALHLSRQAVTLDTIGAIVTVEDSKISERNVRLTTRLGAWSTSTAAVEGRLLVYLPSSPAAEAVRVGDRLRLRGVVQSIDPPTNPFAFDAAAYYALQGVYHRLSVRGEENWESLGAGRRSPYVVAQSLRRQAEKTLQRYLKGDELAVASALILCKKDRLSSELRNTYADTGAMHVLAVSGLHVGIVGQFVFWLLALPLGRNRWTRLARLLLTLAAIWGFALLTGLAASVQRAALMFSLFYFGNSLFNRRSGGYNSLAFAAFILLIYQPLQLFTVSFQLSFSAVAGILFFQRRLAQLLYFRNGVLRYSWELSCVGIAAQLGTLPLTLYYFHQFPLYFLLSGIPVVIGATAGLSSGLLLLALAKLPMVGSLLGALLGGVIWLQNSFLVALQRLPGAVVDQIWVPLPQVVILYLLVAALGALLVYRHVRYLRLLIWLLIVLGGWRAVTRWQVHDQALFVVYDLYRETAVDYVRGKQAIAWSSLPAGSGSLAYATETWRAARGYDTTAVWALPEAEKRTPQSSLLRLNDKRLLILDRRVDPPAPPTGPIDYVLVRDNVWPSRLAQASGLAPERIILDGSNSPRTREAWREWAREQRVALHCTATEGAFVGSLK